MSRYGDFHGDDRQTDRLTDRQTDRQTDYFTPAHARGVKGSGASNNTIRGLVNYVLTLVLCGKTWIHSHRAQCLADYIMVTFEKRLQ